MKWKALLSLAVLAATLLPQAAWSRNHHLLDGITNTPANGVLNNITHSGSSILNNPLTNSSSGLLHNSLIGSTNNGLVKNTLNNGSGLFHRKRHRGLLAWIRDLLFGSSSNNNLGTFGNKNYQSYSGSIFNNNSHSILNNGGGGVRGFFNRI